MLRLGDNFISSLNKVYGLYTLGFLGFVILMAILEVAGHGSVSTTVEVLALALPRIRITQLWIIQGPQYSR